MSSKLTLLVVGTTPEITDPVNRILGEAGYDPALVEVGDLSEVPSALSEADADLLLCDPQRNGRSVEEVVAAVEATGMDVPVLVIAGSEDPDAAIDAIRRGAADWIVSDHLDRRLLPSVERALQRVRERERSARVEAELASSRRRYHDLAETLPQVVYELDRAGRFMFVNRRGLELLGYTEEDLERHPHVATLIAEEERPRAMERIRRVFEGEVLDDGAEYTVLRGDGTPVPAMVYSGPIVERGQVVGLRGVLVDLREIRRAERELHATEERYRRLVETMGDGLATIDRDGKITYANRALARIMKRGVDEIMGHDAREMFDEENAAILEHNIRRRLSAGNPAAYEIEALSPEGEPIPLLITSTPLRDETGRITGSLGVVKDMTGQREGRDQLLRIKAALDNASDAIGMADGNRVPVYLNPSFQEMFGCTAEQLRDAGGPIANFANEQEYYRVFQQVERDDSFVGEFEGRHMSGRTFPVMGRVDAVRDPRGDLTGIVAVFTDITRRRRREQRRRLTTARLSLLNDLNQMLNAGESVEDIIAAAADELCKIIDAWHIHIFLRRTGEEGDELFLRFSNMPAEAEARVFGRPLADGAEMVMPLRPDTRVWKLYETGEPLEVREEDIPHTVADIDRWAEPKPIIDSVQIAETLGVKYLCVVPLVRGGDIIGHLTVSRREDRPLSDPETDLLNALTGQVAVILDRARSEHEITRLNHFLEAIIENAAVWFSVLDEDQQIVIWNRAARQISGYAHADIRSGAHLMELLYPDADDRARAYEYVQAAFAGEDPGEIETTITRADGARRRVAWHLRRFTTDERRVGLVVVGRDVTESRELQQQLERVQRMDAVGTFAGGIAHDFNNVLTAIIGHADLLCTEADDDSGICGHGEQIAMNARRASRLTRQLLAFSRKQPSQPRIVDLNRLIADMEELFRRMIPESTHLRIDLSPDLGQTRIDPSQVEQIVMNLVLNARDAMPDGGELTVRTANAELSADSVGQLFEATPGEYVTVEVMDTGMGMDEETEAHIFEPFFTTRQGSGGTGLGLSTVYGLVRQNDGAITVHSKPGEGTSFRIYLPRVDGEQTGEQISPQTGDREAVRGDETLLVVEDADSLRDLIVTILTTFGYTVVSASQGEEALELEREHHGEIDLVVSDVVMPEMSGTELADRLLEVAPELRVLLISGYPNDRAVTAGQSDPRFSFLQKPFSAMELGSKVRDILDAH